MPFLLMDDSHADDKAHWRLSDGAFRLNVSAMLWCSRLKMDGLIELDDLPRLMPRYRKALVDELVHAGLWIPLQVAPGTYEIPECLRHNRSRDQIEADREADRIRQRAWRARKRDRERRSDEADLERLLGPSPGGGVTP